MKLVSWEVAAVLMCGVSNGLGVGASGDEFAGPLASWANVKTEFGAVGDGKADDTAAIQKALESVRRQDFPKKVLYFPAGTYRITATLKLERISHHEPLGMSITGEDPEKTIIKWDGAVGQSMVLYNPWYASMSRLRFDGGGKAKTAIQHGVAFSTANEFTDLIIQDVEFGIEAGMRDGIAETAVLRCRFYRCSKAALSIQNFNSLDFYNLTSTYAGQLGGAKRRFTLQPDRRVIIEDQLKGGAKSANVRWGMVTPAVLNKESAACGWLEKGGQRLRLEVLAPAEAVLNSWPANPPPHDFDEPNPGVSIVGFTVPVKAGQEVVLKVVLTPEVR
jgi:hypothetical protein